MHQTTYTSILGLVTSVALGMAVVRQCRRPSGWLGGIFARNMNDRHWALTSWGLSHCAPGPHSVLLDVGCGGGRTVQELARLAREGKVYGVDYSETSVAVARELNAAAVAAGRVEVLHGTISALPFATDMFDLVTAVETHYYWPDLNNDLREIRRVLKSTGRVLLIVESYQGKRFGVVDAVGLRLIGGTILSVEGHREALIAAGFGDVQVFQERRRGWLCAVGTKR